MKYNVLFATTIVVLLSICGCKKSNSEEQNQANEPIIVDTIPPTIEYGIDVTNLQATMGTIGTGEIITSILKREGANDTAIRQLLLLPDSVFNPKIIKAGNKYICYHTSDSAHQLKYWVYAHSVSRFSVFQFDTALVVTEYVKPVVRRSRCSRFEIESSLWNAIAAKDLNINLALSLSDIFAWTVDFFGLQKNDIFKVYYDELYIDSVSIGIDSIRVASFSRNAKTLYAIYYANDDIGGYWDQNGDNLKKAFLKAPLSFSRISSGFSHARRHPVYKTVRPHTGVDYAAPAGTPVMSIGDGVVLERGYKGGGGNTIKIRHNSVYTTAYLHLSRFAQGVSVGSRVSQGQVIGYVGSTGTSTGAHLDFRVWKNGTPINPLTMEIPPSEPIPTQYKEVYDSVAIEMIKILDF